MPKVVDFVNNRHLFLQQTPLQIAGAGGVLPFAVGAGRKITSRDAANNPPADDQSPQLTAVNYNSAVLLGDNRLYLTTYSHPGLSAAANHTWVYFDIEEQCAPYGDSCGGVRMLGAPGAGAGAANRRAYYLPYYRNKISQITLGAHADYFFTDNLSGCALYVDETNPNAPVVCHANAMNISNHADQARPRDFMRGMFNHLALNRDRTLEKGDYWAAGNDAGFNALVTRKQSWSLSHGFRDVDAGASGLVAAFVVGFRDAVADTWTFYYQTLGMVKYDRPFFSPSRQNQATVHRMVVSHSAQIV